MNDTLIESKPDVMMDELDIAGTCITVELVLERLAAGESIEQLLEAFARPSEEASRAAIVYGEDGLSVFPDKGSVANRPWHNPHGASSRRDDWNSVSSRPSGSSQQRVRGLSSKLLGY